MPAFDKLDRSILELIQEDGRLSNAELAGRVGLSPPACWKRLKKLEDEYIAGYHAHLKPKALGLGVFAFVSITLDGHSEELSDCFEKGVQTIPNIVACHNISGRYDYVLQVVAKDMEEFHELTMRKIRRLGNVKEMNTSFSLKQIKLSACLPLE
ncbi:Lrp/AsnC family transcriptional regulator [Pseudomonas syringae]|uniref:Lrp/AsnC family transcriptional regulator n=1 Tax=Pseudomonas syringae TaxID=317 RepID=UPI0018E5FC54|nr:Lrp/AsnC family transcriptional regulator [Pseudomonas syringae]MBI6770545.1 Lrp/AsnC family transcriptional regulator [Pseudomonas syringae]MBI6778243.1 Lrp/AsnC family transcriptional regulator [Pseudomonas syringae]MBI6790873.1 Lrp/AsnC family transcriptional regulator [Pseudomonas syringae]MBI6803726.1 Lrp/AsnC family transcriptional regulator [Pseudomonas syringae]MBI6833462.1 Lrp/AsnC family transcriptional regulator [Pseudomonas syringae]